VDFGLFQKRTPEFAAEFDKHIELHRSVIAEKERSAQMQAVAMQTMAEQNKGGRTQ
jgi:hypothetical protein